MQWNSQKNSGFSTAERTWLRVANNYTVCNVEQQLKDKRSFFRTFGDLMALRQNPTLKYGEIDLKSVDDEVLVYKRQIKNNAQADIVAVVLNFEGNTKTINLNDHLDGLPEKMKTVTASIHSTIAPGYLFSLWNDFRLGIELDFNLIFEFTVMRSKPRMLSYRLMPELYSSERNKTQYESIIDEMIKGIVVTKSKGFEELLLFSFLNNFIWLVRINSIELNNQMKWFR